MYVKFISFSSIYGDISVDMVAAEKHFFVVDRKEAWQGSVTMR